MNKLLLLLLIVTIISILLQKDTNTLLVILILTIIFLFYYYKELKKEVQENKYIYLEKEKEFVNIIENVKFIKKYDKTRYNEILLLSDKFNKTYIFMMSDRWDIPHFLPILKDLRKEILEKLYSIYLIIPKKSKKLFGFEPYKELEKTINNFDKYSIEKIEIVKKYAYEFQNKKHLIETRIDASNEREKILLP
jgi:Ca2+/Na+ antiporter